MADYMETIRRLRAERGWSQQRLADEAGLSRQTISAIENNPRHRVGVETQERLADAFGIPFGEFVYLLSSSGLERLAAEAYETELRIKDAAARAMHREIDRAIEEADHPGPIKEFLRGMHYGVTLDGYVSPFNRRDLPDYYWPDEPKNEAPTPAKAKGTSETATPHLTSKGFALDIVPC